jgi:radical SAM-linked protein
MIDSMKIVFEIAKTDNLVYISHLDMMRLFLRVLRMSGLRPAYSRGFNPHPKMSFALPLPLGIYSVCELFEFETPGGAESASFLRSSVDIVNERLPEGVRVKAWCQKPESIIKSLASCVDAAVYEFMCDGITEAPGKLEAFFAKESIMIIKRDKKTGAETEKDIRGQMESFRIVKDMRGRMLAEVTLSASQGNTLGPVSFFSAFCAETELDINSLAPIITRTMILGTDGAPVSEKLNFRRR